MSDSPPAPRPESVVRHYDDVMYSPSYLEFFEGSDFANYGYWEEDTVHARQASENLLERLMERVPEKAGCLLDVACGKGETTRYLLKYYPPEALTGINISEKQIETARQHVPGATFRCMDATELDFPDASFDTVLCIEAAFHFRTRERFFAEALRVLKPGGRLVLSDELMTREGEDWRPYRHVENFLPDPSAYEALCTRAGFEDVEVSDVTAQTWHAHFLHLVERAHRKFLRKELDLETLRSHLHYLHLLGRDLTFYLLVSVRRP